MAISYNTALVVDSDDETCGYVDDNGTTRYLEPQRGYTAVALADAAATLTAAQLLDSGVFTITPSAGRALTTDTAALIIAAMPSNAAVGYSVDFTIVCLAAFAATLTAGVGVTIVGSAAVNNVSGTFRIRKDSASAVTIYRL